MIGGRIIKTTPSTGGSGGILVQGVINVPSDFPTLATVNDGDVYIIGANVTDNDPLKTNTGQSFALGSEIFWNAGTTAWIAFGLEYQITDSLGTTYVKTEYNPGAGSNKITAGIAGSPVYDQMDVIEVQIGSVNITGQQASSSSNQSGGQVVISGGTGDTSGIGGYLLFNGGTNNNYGPGGIIYGKGGDAGANDDGFGNYSNGGDIYREGGAAYGNATSGGVAISSGICDGLDGSSGIITIGTYSAGSNSGTSGGISISTGEAPGGVSGNISMSTGYNSAQRGDTIINTRRVLISDIPGNNNAYELLYMEGNSTSALSGQYPASNIVNQNNAQGDGDTTFNRASVVASAKQNGVQVWMTAGDELPGALNLGLQGGQVGTLTNHDVQFVRSVYSIDPLTYIRMIMGATYLELQRYGANPGETMELRFQDTTGSGYVSMKAPDTASSNYNIILPADAPLAIGNVLTVQSITGNDIQMDFTSVAGSIPLTQDHILIGNASNLADEVPLVVDANQTFVLNGVDLLTTGTIEIVPSIAGKNCFVKDIKILITAEAGVGATDPVINIGTTPGAWSEFLTGEVLTAPALGTLYENFTFTSSFSSIDTNNVRIEIDTPASGRTQLECQIIFNCYVA